MNTTLNVKLEQGMTDEQIEQYRSIVECACGDNEVQVSQYFTMDGPAAMLQAQFSTDDIDRLNYALKVLHAENTNETNHHRPFTVSIENDIIDPSLVTLFNSRITPVENNMVMMDHIMSVMASDLQKQKEQLEAVHNFIQKSGLLNYKSTMSALIESIGDAGLIDKAKFKESLTNLPTTH